MILFLRRVGSNWSLRRLVNQVGNRCAISQAAVGHSQSVGRTGVVEFLRVLGVSIDKGAAAMTCCPQLCQSLPSRSFHVNIYCFTWWVYTMKVVASSSSLRHWMFLIWNLSPTASSSRYPDTQRPFGPGSGVVKWMPDYSESLPISNKASSWSSRVL